MTIFQFFCHHQGASPKPTSTIHNQRSCKVQWVEYNVEPSVWKTLLPDNYIYGYFFDGSIMIYLWDINLGYDLKKSSKLLSLEPKQISDLAQEFEFKILLCETLDVFQKITSRRYGRAQSRNVFYSLLSHQILPSKKDCLSSKVVFHQK